MKRGFDRTQRIADLIQKTLGQMLLTEMHDDRFRFVMVTGVELTKDLALAKVFVSVYNDDEKKIIEIVDALNNAAKALRYQLAQKVELRVIPKLKFYYDESTARGFRISNLIDSAIKKQEK